MEAVALSHVRPQPPLPACSTYNSRTSSYRSTYRNINTIPATTSCPQKRPPHDTTPKPNPPSYLLRWHRWQLMLFSVTRKRLLYSLLAFRCAAPATPAGTGSPGHLVTAAAVPLFPLLLPAFPPLEDDDDDDNLAPPGERTREEAA